jgi:purine nucleoside phosphorylase
MSKIAVIGGTGLTQLDTLEIVRREVVHTPYGEPSGVVVHGELAGQEVVFLARHGHGHTIPPHRINYRANLYALYQIGVKKIIAVAAVGGINDLRPGQIAFPDQIIDYTYSREQTFFADINVPVTHIDFTHPYCPELRQLMIRAATELGLYQAGFMGRRRAPGLKQRLKFAECARMGVIMWA